MSDTNKCIHVRRNDQDDGCNLVATHLRAKIIKCHKIIILGNSQISIRNSGTFYKEKTPD